MLSRYILKPSHLRFLTLLSSKPHPIPISQNPSFPHFTPRFYSSNNNNGSNRDLPEVWNLSSTTDPTAESLFPEEPTSPNHPPHQINPQNGNNNVDAIFKNQEIQFRGAGGGGLFDRDEKKCGKVESWGVGDEDDDGDDIFKKGGIEGGDEIKLEKVESWGVGDEDDIFKKEEVQGGGGDWDTDGGINSWDFSVGADEEGKVEDELFKNVEMKGADGYGLGTVLEKRVDMKQLESEEKRLVAVIKGPDRAFGDLIAASGITDEMLDSLIALKDLEGIQGLPPLTEIEDSRYEKNTKKSTRADIERQKQEEVYRARVREVDSKGRAYGTGRRKCSIARVWIQPGDGKFVVNDQEFDVYFPMLDHRATLLRPFTETKTLGSWDVSCTVKGGGTSGQVGAVRLGISRALQCWDPNLRPPLKQAGFLTRDPRVVERKKPGKAKARKSFQWVKR